jgi:hypothetical protein
MTVATLAYLALLNSWAVMEHDMAPAIPQVRTDYQAALEEAARTHKAVIVFIGNGAASVRQQLQDNALPAEAIELLRQRYVVVEISRQQAEGRALADLFELTEGVVISSRGGRYQVFRHGGSWHIRQLLPQLRRYAEVDQPTTTVCSGSALTTTAGSSSDSTNSSTTNALTPCNGGSCPGATSYGRTVVPARGYYYVVPSSTCPNGNCYRR